MYTDKVFNMDLIRGMNAIVISLNNEDAYDLWTLVIPDDATEEDFEDICEDADLFQSAVHAFMKIMNTYGKDGLYLQTTVGDTYITRLFTGKRGEQ